MKNLMVFHTNGQEIIAELIDYKENKAVVKNCFQITREHAIVRDSVATMIILDAITETKDEVEINKDLCCIIRKALKDEVKSYENILAKMSDIIVPQKPELIL